MKTDENHSDPHDIINQIVIHPRTICEMMSESLAPPDNTPASDHSLYTEMRWTGPIMWMNVRDTTIALIPTVLI